MLIPDNVRKCVAFLGYQLASGDYKLAGSAFYLGRDSAPGKADPVYVVTARHVIDGIRSKGVTDTYLRFNHISGDAAWQQIPMNSWFYHPNDSSVDIAIARTTVPGEFDHLVFPYSLCITDELMKLNEIGLGDEVFITGLFRHHHGNRRNIPIVRTGNLAALSEEKISTQRFGEIDACLIEARSIGGLSGSPVFLNLGSIRMLKGELKTAPSQPIVLLFGLVHGHYDIEATAIDQTKSDMAAPLTTNLVNTGIAIVVPFHKLDEVVLAFEKQQAVNGSAP